MAASSGAKPKSVSTRSVTNHWLFGQHISDVSNNYLPLKIDAVKLYLFKCHERGKSRFLESEKNDIIKEISVRFIQIWTDASLPLKTEKAINSQLKREILDILEVASRKTPSTASEKWKEDTYRKYKLNQLLDICSCTCFINSQKVDIKIELCKCETKLKIPEEELDFYIDQKFDRNKFISSYKDLKTQKKYDLEQAKFARKIQREEPKRLEKQRVRESSLFDSIDPTTSDFASSFLDPDDPETFDDETQSSPEKSGPLRNKKDYRCFISYAERLGLNDKAIAGLINAVNVDYGITDPSFYTCESKVTTLKQKYGLERTKSHFENGEELICISFDRKRCDIKGKGKNVSKEEVITCVSEPQGEYLYHFIPENAKADTVATDVFHVIQSYNGEDSLLATLVDGTNSNTGVSGGAVRYLEVFLSRSLQWLVCLLHYNELPFNKIVKLYSGKTTGPNSRSGELGKEIEKTLTEVKPIVNFKFIPGKVDKINSTLLLNSDQKYLYDLCHCCQSKMGKEIFLQLYGDNPRGPSALSTARWLHYAIAVARLYIQTENPEDDLIRLVTIVLNMYAPNFFNIKSNSDASMGSKHYFNILNDARNILTEDEFKEAKISIDFNSFMAHSENILLCAAYDSDLEIRRKGIDLILKARRRNDPNVLRQFVKPKINYEAKNYFELLDKSKIYEPPLLRIFSNERLLECAAGRDLPLSNIPCHSTNTERAVQNTTLACKSVIGEDRRHEFLLNLAENREKIPTRFTKGDFITYTKT